jgi:hypothetical protein
VVAEVLVVDTLEEEKDMVQMVVEMVETNLLV